MNPFEKATRLGQKLFEIQTSTMTELARMQQENVQKYIQMNQEFASRLGEARDPQSLIELQREVGQTMWQNVQSGNEASGELVRKAWEQVGEAYREAFTPDSNDGQ